MKAALQESEEEFEAAFQSATIPSVMADSNHCMFRVNGAFCEMLGYSESELLGMCVYDITFPDDVGVSLEAQMQLSAGPALIELEKRYLHKDGHIVFGRVRMSPLRGPDNKKLGNFEQVIESTEKKQIEAENEHFKTTLDLTTDAVFMFSPDTFRFFYANEGAASLFHCTREDILAMTPFDLTPDEDESEVRKMLLELQGESESIRVFDTVRRTADGQDIPVEITLQYMAPKNEPARFMSIVRDISERKLAEAKLRASEEKVRAIIASVLDGVISIDERGFIETFNPAAERIFGYSADEATGRPVSMLMLDSDAAAHQTYIENYMSTGQGGIIGFGREVSGRRKDGTEFPMYLSISEMSEMEWPHEERRQGARRMFIGTVQDLTERKTAEKALRQAQKMDALGHLTGGIAHDFNNLVGVIIGNADFLKRSEALGERDRKRVEVIMKSARRGADLTKRLLTFARQGPQETKVTDVNALVVGMSEILQRSLAVQIVLAIRTAKDPWHVEVDRADLENTLLNLALNAYDAMPNGGKLVIETNNVVLEAQSPIASPGLAAGEYVQISVSDTGCGMTPAIWKQCLEPFFTTKTEGNGSGLGLSMAYAFANRSKGSLELESEPGRGTVVRIYLPRSLKAAEYTIDKNRDSEPAPTGEETILIVDDNLDLGEVARDWLGELGYHVLIAHDSGEAKRLLTSNGNVDLLFSDVVMPGDGDGFDLADWTTRHVPHANILLTSGYTKKVTNQKDWPKNDCPLLYKPYTKSELAQRVRETLDG